MTKPIAVVTGASSGIGHATARRLAAEGFTVVAAARRADKIEALCQQIDGVAVFHQTPTTALPESPSAIPFVCDITVQSDVDALASKVSQLGGCTLLVNNAGGAIGLEPVVAADVDDWRQMYEVNVLGTLRVTKALLPALVDSGAGSIVIVSSTAGLAVYEGGGGYTAAKHAETAMAETLRLELCGEPVRVIEIDPGMVKTDEFATVRFRGDTDRAAAVYAGVAEPLVADDIADCIAWVATRPHHVNIDRLVVKPLAQAAGHKVHRTT